MKDSLALRRESSALLQSEAEAAITQMGRKLLKLQVGGRQLTAQEAASLAVLSYMLDANPFNNEIYWTRIGPMIGITLYRRKALEWMQYETGKSGNTLRKEVRVALTSECEFRPENGDIAYHVTVYDSVSLGKWQSEVIDLMAKLKVADPEMTGEKLYEIALGMAGPKPCETGVGIVFAKETFTKSDGDPEMFSRHERAQKRAEKVAIRKRFPSILIPDREVMETTDDIIDANVRDLVVKKLDEPTNTIFDTGEFDEVTNLRKMGVQVDQAVETLYDLKAEPLVQDCVKVAAGLEIKPETPVETIEKLAKIYRGWRDLDKSMEEACELALAGALPE